MDNSKTILLSVFVTKFKEKKRANVTFTFFPALTMSKRRERHPIELKIWYHMNVEQTRCVNVMITSRSKEWPGSITYLVVIREYDATAEDDDEEDGSWHEGSLCVLPEAWIGS